MKSDSAKSFRAVHYERKQNPDYDCIKRFDCSNAERILEFHKSFPEYSMTPLAELKSFAGSAGVRNIYVKDESCRFGLNAFKVLGGSYAIGSYIAETLGVNITDLHYERLVSDEVRKKLGELTFVTATDGNHGRGVAWTANRLGQKSVVYMPKGSAKERLDNIKALGSDASITDMNYDDAVRLAKENAEKYGWILIQDTSWEGYEEIPCRIMEGYITMAYEAALQLKEEKPTHIFLQAGVGAMSGAVTAFFENLYRDDPLKPVITIVEPNAADCIYRSAKKGNIEFVTGDMKSIMAGLCCGEPCGIAWDILKNHAQNFASVPDYVTEEGMRILGRGTGDDPKVISGESGAVTLGLVAELMRNEELGWLKEQIGLDENSTVLCFSTEGDTDRDNYRRILRATNEDSFTHVT